jgi:predicted unusual protein kinase regulating ubiquinone biosynthesis (AarF/ABC1/UbiB family)
MSKPPRSRLGRLARLGRLTSKVTGSYMGHQLRGMFQSDEESNADLDRVHVENARRVADVMGQLKGAAMKVGQGLALAVEGMDLPPEVAGAMRKLNDKAEPIPFAFIKADVELELERPLTEAFQSFDPNPIGTASLGQAHAATLPDGEPVVVKVLHRGIESSVGSDLAALKAMFISSRILRRDRSEVEAIFAEIRDRLNEELDYYQEAANLEFFNKAFADDQAIRIPRTRPSHCTERVLTMERLRGMTLETFLNEGNPRAHQKAGLALARSFHVMTYQLRALHADPHAGNYLFEPDGRVGILDFGCVKRLDLYWIANYARVALAAFDRDRDTTIRLLREMGALTGERKEAEDLLWQMADLMADPFRGGVYTAGSHKDAVQAKLRRMAPHLIRYPEIRSPRDMIYLHRTLGGIYAMLRKMETRADWGALCRPYLEGVVAEAEGRRPAG